MKFVLLCTLLLSIALIMASAQKEDSDRELYQQHNDHHRDRSVRSLTPEEQAPARLPKPKTKDEDVVGCCG